MRGVSTDPGVQKPAVPATERITSILVALREKQPEAFNHLVAVVYPELRRIARRELRRTQRGGTPDTGSIVNETYLKLIDQTRVNWQNRNHFFAIAARAMRQVLIDRARKRERQKRGGGIEEVTLDDRVSAIQTEPEKLLVIDDLLNRMEAVEPRWREVFECRFFGGYSESETAAIVGRSTRTVQREWQLAKTWLAGISKGHQAHPSRKDRA